MFHVTRRQFVTGGLAVAVGAPLGLADDNASRPESKLKLSLAAYSCRQRLTQRWYTRGRTMPEGDWSLFEFIDFAATTGVDAVELTGYYFPNPLTEAMAAAVKTHAFRRGLDISGTAIGNNFCRPNSPARDDELALARQWIGHAERIDAPVIRIFAGSVPRGETKANAIAQCAATIRELLPDAEASGVVLALENHGGITADPDDMLEIIRQVGESPAFGVNFDSGNFKRPDPYAGLEKIAPYTVNAQLKLSVRRERKGPKEPTDIERVIRILKAADYRGYIALEYEEAGDPLTEIPRVIERVRRLI